MEATQKLLLLECRTICPKESRDQRFYLCRQTRQGMNIRFIEAHSAERPLLSTHAQGRAEHVFGDLKCPCPSEIFP